MDTTSFAASAFSARIAVWLTTAISCSIRLSPARASFGWTVQTPPGWPVFQAFSSDSTSPPRPSPTLARTAAVTHAGEVGMRPVQELFRDERAPAPVAPRQKPPRRARGTGIDVLDRGVAGESALAFPQLEPTGRLVASRAVARSAACRRIVIRAAAAAVISGAILDNRFYSERPLRTDRGFFLCANSSDAERYSEQGRSSALVLHCPGELDASCPGI